MSSVKSLLLIAILPASLGLAQSAPATGALQGSVTDPQGTALAGAVVRALRPANGSQSTERARLCWVPVVSRMARPRR